MERPSPRDLGHDLRNLIGLVRAVTCELDPLVAAEARTAWTDLDRYSRFAMDALRVLERWDDTRPTDVHLGALMWAVRLLVRDVAVGDVANVGRVELIVPEALTAIVGLVRAMGGAVSAEAMSAGVEIVSHARVDIGIASASVAVRRVGLEVQVGDASVRITPARR